jgi:hypothetical protein
MLRLRTNKYLFSFIMLKTLKLFLLFVIGNFIINIAILKILSILFFIFKNGHLVFLIKNQRMIVFQVGD